MEAKSSPFSIYDLIGYFIPGASLLLVGAAILKANHHPWLQDRIDKVDSLEKYLPFFLAAYVAGQVNALLSSLTIERYAIYSHGYPSKTLLNMRHDGYWKSAGGTLGAILALALLPVSLLDYLFGRLCGLSKFSGRPLDKLLDAVLRRRVYRLLRTFNYGNKITSHGTARSTDFFRLVYHFAVENAPTHFPKMQNYVALFGFFRAFSLIALFVFWSQIFYSLASIDLYSSFDTAAVGMILATGFLSYVFFVGFLKFYRRFSLEAIMAAIVVFEPPRGFEKKTRRSGLTWAQEVRKLADK